MAKDFFYSKLQVDNLFESIKAALGKEVDRARLEADRSSAASSTALGAQGDTGPRQITSMPVGTPHSTINWFRRIGNVVYMSFGWRDGPAGSGTVIPIPSWATPASSLMTDSTLGASMFIRAGAVSDVYGYNLKATSEMQYMHAVWVTNAPFPNELNIAPETSVGFVDGTVASFVSNAASATYRALSSVFVRKGDNDSSNTIYISPSGSDNNDGLTTGTAFKTFQKAFEYLATQGPILQGQWIISAAAGVYPINSGQQTLRTRSVERVVVKGASPVNGVPTTIINGAGGGNYSHGLSMSGIGVRGTFKDLKFVNFNGDAAGNTRVACLGEQEADVNFENIHASDCSWAGLYVFNTVRARVTGGILERSRFGFNANMVQTTLKGVTLRNNTQAGAAWTRGAQGHLDDCIVDDNAIGLLVSENSRVDTVNNDFRRNKYGIKTVSGGYYAEGGVPNRYYIGTSDKNKIAAVISGAYSGNSIYQENSASSTRVAYDRTTLKHIGTNARTVLKTLPAIPVEYVAGAGKEIRVEIFGTVTSVNRGSDIRVRIGSITTPLAFTPTTVAETFTVEMSLLEVQGGHRVFGTLTQGTTASRVGNAGGVLDVTTDQEITIDTLLTDTSNVMTIYRVNTYLVG